MHKAQQGCNLKLLQYTKKDKIYQSWVRDDDDNPEIGIPHNPPNLDDIDWEIIKTEIHNLLVENNLINWIDVQKSGNMLNNIVLTVVKRRLVNLYKIKNKEL